MWNSLKNQLVAFAQGGHEKACQTLGFKMKVFMPKIFNKCSCFSLCFNVINIHQ